MPICFLLLAAPLTPSTLTFLSLNCLYFYAPFGWNIQSECKTAYFSRGSLAFILGFMDTQSHSAFTLSGVKNKIAIWLALKQSQGMHQAARPSFLPPHTCFFAQPVQRWEGQLQALPDSVSHSSRKKHEDYKKGKILPREAFTPSLCSFVPRSPRLPLGASQHLFYWPLLCVTKQIGFYSQVWVEDKCECSITFCIRLELSGCEWVCPSLSAGAEMCMSLRV